MTEQVAVQLVSMELARFRQRRMEIEEAAQAAREKFIADSNDLAKQIEPLRQLIANGNATSGKSINDLLLVAHDDLGDTKLSELFHDIEARMAGKNGQLVLVVQRKRVVEPCEDRGKDLFCLETQNFLGALIGEEFVVDIKKQRYGLPTNSFIKFESDKKAPLKKKEGPFMFSDSHGLQNIGTVISGEHDTGLMIEVLIGDAEVFAYSPSELHPRPGYRPSPWVVALNKAARLLGRNIPEAPEEKIFREEEKRELLRELEGTVVTLQQLRDQDPFSPKEIDECENGLQALLDHSREFGGLENNVWVQLAEAKLRAAARL